MKKQLPLLFYFVLAANIFAQTTFEAPQVIDSNTTDRPYEIEAGDLDNDGDVDLVMATNTNSTDVNNTIRWYKNDGAGNFTVEADVSSTIKWVDGLVIADIDGQFGNDIIASSANQGKLVYFLSDGMGGFASEVVIDGTLAGPGEVVAGDINQDGNMDVAVAVFSDNKTAWYAGDGTGNFTAQSDIENGTTNGPYYMDMADYDGDTDLDVVVGFAVTGTVEVYYNQYIESGSTAVSWVKDTETVDSGNTFIFHVLFGDVNNDGDVDIATVDNSGGDVKWIDKEKDLPPTASVISDNTVIGRPGDIAIADIDGDTFNDFILTSSGGSPGEAIIYFRGADNASPSATRTIITDNNFQMYAIALADFDDDMDLDIGSVGFANDTVFWLENELDELSIGESEVDTIKIYPNPTQNLINFKNVKSPVQIVVHDLIGKEVLRAEINETSTLDISHLNSGMYTLKFEGSEEVIKLLKV